MHQMPLSAEVSLTFNFKLHRQMGCLRRFWGCLGTKRSKQIVPQPGHRSSEAAAALDKALGAILQAAGLGGAAAHKLPASLTSLCQQLQAAVDEMATAAALLATIKQASDTIQSSQSVTFNSTGPSDAGSPAADALVSMVGAILFAQVALDTAAVLTQRHQQLLQVVRCVGFRSLSSLAACLQPATKVMRPGAC